MYSNRSNLPNGSRKVPIPDPLYAGTTVPLGRPVVVFGDGTGSYWRLRSQYWVYEPLLCRTVSADNATSLGSSCSDISVCTVRLTSCNHRELQDQTRDLSNSMLEQRNLPEIGPKAMNSPISSRQQLAFGFTASVDIPELRRDQQPAESLNAA